MNREKSKRRIIAFCGSIGCGKTTACYQLARYGYQTMNFADKLKDIGLLIGFEYSEMYGTQEEKLRVNRHFGVSGREFLQKFGTEICRNEFARHLPNFNLNGRSLWVRLIELALSTRFNQNIVIGDCRFADEADMIIENGGFIVKIVRTNDQNAQDEQKNNQILLHASESAIDGIKPHFIIYNNGSKELFENKLKTLIRLFDSFVEKNNWPVYL